MMRVLKTKLCLSTVAVMLLAAPAFASNAHRSDQSIQLQTSLIDEVVLDGRVIGSDPDPRIRGELLRGYSSREGD
jgi:hypothetical protein